MVTQFMAFIPFARPPFFTGRKLVLQTLREKLLRERITILMGPSGVGKTTVALEYVARFAEKYQLVLWVNARTNETLLANTLELMQQLAGPGSCDLKLGQPLLALQNWLADKQEYLLILDNVELQAMPLPFPDLVRLTGHLLLLTHANEEHLTTRSGQEPATTLPREKHPSITAIALEYLDAQYGAPLILRRASLLPMTASLEDAPDAWRKAALELARELHGSPLALNLIGGYLQETGKDIQDAMLFYRNYIISRPPLLKQEPVDIEALDSLCHLISAFLQQIHPAAAELWQICAFLAPDAIPLVLFEQVTPGAGSSHHEGEQKSAARGRAVQILLACGILISQDREGLVNMHPLLQARIRLALSLDEQQRLVEQALHAVHRLLSSIEGEPLATRISMAGHIQSLAELSQEWTFTFAESAEVFAWAASLLAEQGLPHKAEPLLQRALVIWERTRGHAHPAVTMTVLNLATLNTLLKNYIQAEVLWQRAIIAQAHAQNADYPAMLLSLNNLGHIYAEQDKPREAYLCYQKAISLGERVGLLDHALCVLSMHDLALMEFEQARFDEAETLLQRVCASWDWDPEAREQLIAQAHQCLAKVSLKLGNWEQAEFCSRRVLSMHETKLGREHPDTLRTQIQLAYALLEQDKLVEAEALFLQTRHVRERSLGEKHPEVAACIHGLAQVALAHGQFNEAQALCKHALDIYENRSEPEDLTLTNILDSLATAYTAQEMYDQAILVLERSLHIRRRILGEDNPALVDNLSNLADLYLTQKRQEEAKSLLLSTLAIYQNAQGLKGLALDSVLNNLATIAMECERVEQAAMYPGFEHSGNQKLE